MSLRPDPPEPRPATVLFDFDGTIVHGDAFFGFILALLRKRPRRIPPTLLCASVLGPGIAHPSTMTRALSAMLWSAVFGLDREALGREMDAYVAQRASRGRWLHTQARERIEQHRAHGARIVVVTGCEQSLAERICRALSLGPLDIVGSRIEPYARSFIVSAHCHHARKLACLAERGVEPPWDLVYTDSARDLPIICHARRVTLINASHRTTRLVRARFGGEIVQERWTRDARYAETHSR